MSRQHRCQIHRTGAFRAVESPHRFRVVGVHVHRLRAIAPTRCHRDGAAHSLPFKLLRTGGTLSHPANRRVGNDTLHRRAVAILHVGTDEISHRLRQQHCFLFQTFSHTTLSSVDGGAHANFRILCHRSQYFLLQSYGLFPQYRRTEFTKDRTKLTIEDDCECHELFYDGFVIFLTTN